ncbi:MAG: FAD binding domain-containing protein [Cyanobacteria bacterium P01_E01_bin.6]
MDLHNVQSYLRPRGLDELPSWEKGWAWLAGGTWLFSEAQPHLTTLVDMQQMGWDELEERDDGLMIGATCTMSQLLAFESPPHWPGFKSLCRAAHELASFKIQNVATIAGNVCLALPASTFAPVMVLLNARYQLQTLSGDRRTVAASEFQIGAKQTVLQPGEVLRLIHIPSEFLEWQVSYRRICVATAGIAVSIVVAARHGKTGEVRFGIGGCLAVPQLLTFATTPSASELCEQLDRTISLSSFMDDETASARYRHHVTTVLMERSLHELCSG